MWSGKWLWDATNTLPPQKHKSTSRTVRNKFVKNLNILKLCYQPYECKQKNLKMARKPCAVFILVLTWL